MADFPIFHGITLAANSYVENLHVEQLASDPVPALPGRVWYNTTDKVWKQSTLDAGGAVVVRSFATVENLTAAVASINSATADEVTRATNAEQAIASDLLDEVTRATTAEQAIAADLVTETTRAVAAEQALGLRIDALGNAFNYVGTLTGGASAGAAFDLADLTEKDSGDYYKVTAAGYFKVGAGAPFFANLNDGLVFNLVGEVDKIDNTDSAVAGTTNYVSVTGSTDSGYVVDIDTAFKDRVSTLESGLASEITARTTADTALDTRVTTVESQVSGKIGDLTTLTTTEKGTLVGAINELDSDLAAEVSARTTAVSTLTSDLSTEVTARQNAVSALQNELDATQSGAGLGADGAYTANGSAHYIAAATSLKDADNKLDAALKVVADNLAAEISDRATADSQIRTDYNARRFQFSSASAATQHTVTHNLNSQFVDFTVWVQRADGSWRNDIVSVRATDANSMTVYLSSAANVKLSVTSMADL